MKVTKDEYELPIAVADSAAELSRITGSPLESIHSAISRKKFGKVDKSQYICIEVEEDADEILS